MSDPGLTIFTSVTNYNKRKNSPLLYYTFYYIDRLNNKTTTKKRSKT